MRETELLGSICSGASTFTTALSVSQNAIKRYLKIAFFEVVTPGLGPLHSFVAGHIIPGVSLHS